MILVTGGAGYIGSHTVLALKEAGYKTVVFDSLERGHRDLCFGDFFVRGDLRDYDQIESVFRAHPIDGVVHFAASSLVGQSMADPEGYYLNNLTGTLNLLRAMRTVEVSRIVFSSSASVYGEPETIPITEDAKKDQTSVYGETKYWIERMLDSYCRSYGFGAIALRYFNAAGCDPACRTGEDHTPETHLIPLVLDVALGRRESISVFGDDYPTDDGTCVRDYIHVTDLAEAHVLSLKKLFDEGKPFRASYNLGNGKGYSVSQVIEVVREVTGHPIPTEIGPRRAGDPVVLVASSALAERELGWSQAHADLKEIVETAWAWHKKRFS